MAYLHYLIGYSLVVLSLIKCSESIQCYQCNSHDDQRCADNNPPDEFKRECTSNEPDHEDYSLCRKIKQTIDFNVNGLIGDTRVIRGCGWDRSAYVGRCYHRSGFGGRQEVCSCENELCNSSSIVFASIPLVSAMFVLLKLYL